MTTVFSFRTVAAAIACAIPTAMVGAQAALAEAIQFTLINDSSQEVYYLYVSPSASEFWGEDLLGDTVIASGASEEIIIDDGSDTCMYDLLAVSDSGDEVEEYELDLCEISTYTISD
ncbi:MAG: hypothetical protein AAFQ89_13970 [Cyanobacteria bacterium J06626_18]